MSDNVDAEELSAVYEHIWFAHGGGAYEALDRSLRPRPPEMLYDFVEGFNLTADSTALDVGCGKGNHTGELARRFHLRVFGIDPVDGNLEIARDATSGRGLAGRVTFMKGGMESIPFEDAAFDLIWCRDMLVHVQDLQRGFKECGRVLKPDGHMLVFTTYATERMEPKEAAHIYGALGIVPENMSPSYVEGCFAEAGFQVLTNQTIGSELMQYYEERDGRCTRELMRLARMIQTKERFLAELGEANYRVTSALYHWVIYQLIGKLSSAVYTLEKPAPESARPPRPLSNTGRS
jgi:SAM-dependent methyltransferase